MNTGMNQDLLQPINNLDQLGKGLIIGNRIPKDYFITKGKGESNIAIHAGSYHLALKDAGIEMGNIMTYSSILPGISQEIAKPEHMIHGAVMESIMAVGTCNKGERVSAGIIFGMLYDKKTGEKYGGLVCENQGSFPVEEIEKNLMASLDELYTNGFDEQFDMRDIRVISDTLVPKKQYGTVLIALCFTNYFYPVISANL
ncbi:MAG: pyruvoyl-dependent arginine decarboxylase [Bacteroidales bacterium]|nr:pyruvoyl-dependent arginine decarboxylase [Bacteroidales bacterium]